MKKLLLVLMVALCGQLVSGQVQFGIKAGVNYNSDSFSNVTNDVFSGAKSKTGYHAGVWLRAKFLGVYVRPELVYTQLKNDVTYSGNPTLPKGTSYTFSKIDVPVLIGKRVLKVVNIFAGPSFQYITSSDFSLSDITNVKTGDL